ncbi:MAG TPA: cold shock domain-containing protein [Candidatus Polarisedimenticolia bacterium]
MSRARAGGPHLSATVEFILKKEGRMARGTIAKVVRDRGFGFIRGNDGRDIFFHRSGLVNLNFDDLEQGVSVDFEVEKGAKGLRAANVRSAPAGMITGTE